MDRRLMRADMAASQNGKAAGTEASSAGSLASFYDGAPLFAAAISPDGTVLHCNQTLVRHIGRGERELVGAPISNVFADGSATRLLDLLSDGVDDRRHGPLSLELRRVDGSEAQIEAILDWAVIDRDRRCLRVAGMEETRLHRRVRELERSDQMLRGLVESSTEPIWCIEYSEPVDITVSDPEIIRQIFENECYWSMCNDAMARLYDLPEDLDFNRQPVALYFPRSVENEAFAQSILDAGFHVDHALSVDHRHDGTPMYVENSVRCHIEDGRLLRMWGTLRDVTKYQRIQNELTAREREVRGLLSAIADIVVMVDRSGRLQAANPAFRQILGWPIEDWLGKDVGPIIDLDGPFREYSGSGIPCRFPVEVRRVDGATVRCDVVMSTTDHGDGAVRFVAVLRPQPPQERTMAG